MTAERLHPTLPSIDQTLLINLIGNGNVTFHVDFPGYNIFIGGRYAL